MQELIINSYVSIIAASLNTTTLIDRVNYNFILKFERCQNFYTISIFGATF